MDRQRPIDLVVPWVDGSDPAWQGLRRNYAGEEQKPNPLSFRDWGLLRYWFRGVERNLPWINRVYFVTWGHLPPWLNTEHPKLRIVRHAEFIPRQYLPTFSSHPIENHFYLIPGLAEQFILANDDMYFVGPAEPEDYFQNGLPCDFLQLVPITENCTHGFGHILWNDVSLINRHFSPGKCSREHPDKWFADVYPETVKRRNRAGLAWNSFYGFQNRHMPLPYLKESFREVWEAEGDVLRATARNRFRSSNDVNDWAVRYWQLASGRFYPQVPKRSRFASVGDPPETLRDCVLSPENRVICLNEGAEPVDFDSRAEYLRQLFELRLPEMSGFEKF